MAPSPQQPEIGRSGHTDLNPDHSTEVLEAHGRPASKGHVGHVPPDNQPGHHPEHEQNQPDPAAVAERLGIRPDVDDGSADSD
jgi:hypothetical protein